MPTACSDCCTTDLTPAISTPFRAFANMGYVGFIKLVSGKLSSIIPGISNQTLRATRADLNMQQPIDKPDVIDGRIDPTVYRVQPRIIEGGLSLPLIAETFQKDTCPTQSTFQGTDSAAGRLLKTIWCWSTTRNSQGRPQYDDVDAIIRYANHSVFKYTGLIVNELTMRATQEDILSADLSLYGTGRVSMGSHGTNAGATGEAIGDYLSPARVLTWNDISVTGIKNSGSCTGGAATLDRVLFTSNLVRNFEFTLANNALRVYTFNGSLSPADITYGKREITGSLELLGSCEALRSWSETNATRFTEKNELKFAIFAGGDTYQGSQEFKQRDWLETAAPAGHIFAKTFSAVIFEPEEQELTKDLYVTKVKFHAMANDDDGLYEAVDPSTSYFPAWS